MCTEESAPTPPAPDVVPVTKSKSMHPPEVAARIADFNAKLGAALVKGLRNATAAPGKDHERLIENRARPVPPVDLAAWASALQPGKA